MKRSSAVKVLLLISVAIPIVGDFSCAQGPNWRTFATDLVGNWSGTTRVDPPCDLSSERCHAVNNIAFKFDERGNRMKGNYTCAYGNMVCRNGGADNTGKIISRQVSGNLVRLSVVIPADGSNCYYKGQLASSTTARGAYSCYQGGKLVEEGVWEISQASTQ